MRIAIPVAAGKLAQHFGHCEQFALIDVDLQAQQIQGRKVIAAPAHQPGLLPPWLAEQGANVIIAGGMGARAQQIFADHGIRVLVGVPAWEPQAVVEAFLADRLPTGDNLCDH